ncbi:MAG: glycine cleavage system protein GcvH [Anaerolineae bacterium]|nr:glycine cleavage system protein GcvH [Anaerolineae bacterium]
MATANNCNVPEDLFYWVKEHVWIRPEADGTVTIGMTDAAQHLAGIIVTATPKGAGKTVKKGKSSGTVESGKWVGPIKSPVSGEIVAANEAIVKNPKLLNEDPYGVGWFVQIRPDDWATDKADLVTGAQAVAEYEAFLKAEAIDCAGRPGGAQPGA